MSPATNPGPPWEHVFWDMGGTLVDTYPGLDQAFADVIARASHTVELHDISVLTRRSTGTAVVALSDRFGISPDEFLNAESALKQRWEDAPPPAMPGLHEVLAAVPGMNVVVTHRDRASATSLLASLDIEVDDMICTSDGFARKPDPAMYLELVHRHGLDPHQCVGIGDRPIDVTAARAAGMGAVMLETPGIDMNHDAHVEINALSALPPYLGRIE